MTNDTHRRVQARVPYYVDANLLRPGVVVYDMEDSDRTPLKVLRVEPALVCRKPDGTVVEVYAHMAQLIAIAAHPGPACDCDMCRSRMP